MLMIKAQDCKRIKEDIRLEKVIILEKENPLQHADDIYTPSGETL
ncbi:hypothetical protein JOC83_001827 [Bacillus iocasae]|uniref:Uncharacterized protein n=1 Tax=Priestia iocasae TaxID=2291674 RepID=A0ABS2QU92_9BACI|nr:hypothetical protein [Metabacillus iocasae]